MAKKKRTPKKKRAAESRLRDFLGVGPVSSKPLPLVHTTTAYSFADICATEGLEPSYCRVFRKRNLYFFYGRPAYRARDTNNARIEFSWPIVFIFEPTKLRRISAVFPFDTGAFSKGLYKEFFSRHSNLKDFQLDGKLESAARLVDTFYGGPEDYYSGYSRKNVDIPLMQFEAQGIQELSRLPGNQLNGGRRDERSSAIELQTEFGMRFKNALLAIVLPQQYLSEPEIVRALDRWDVKIRRYYEVLHNISSEAWIGQIYKIVADIYREVGYL